jgi:broad specificity phosphatase PhoE
MPIYFIRHGESQANKAGIFAGQTDAILTSHGISQAREAGEKLKSSGLKIDVIVTSPLSRAYDTAAEIAQTIDYPLDKIIINPLLKERNLGSLEGRSNRDSLLKMIAMSEDELTSEGIETVTALVDRAQKALQQLETLEGNILAVSHNGLGRGLLVAKHGLAFYDIQKLPNAQVIDIDELPQLENK